MLSLDDLIAKHALTLHVEAIRRLVRPSVTIRPTPALHEGLAPLDSRFGGLPHLPAGIQWPSWRENPLAHIATVRLSEASQHDRTGLLPKRGLLYFWYDIVNGPWGYDPADRGYCRVDFVEDESQPLVQAALPPAASQKKIAEMTPLHGVYRPCRLSFEPGETLPDWTWIDEHAPESAVFGKLDTYYDLCDELDTSVGVNHRLLGHAKLVQSPWEQECQLVTNGIYCGDSRAHGDPRIETLKAGAKDWRLLLQVDTDESGPGWMWGDVGVLYFTIPEPALRERRFDQAWVILQS